MGVPVLRATFTLRRGVFATLSSPSRQKCLRTGDARRFRASPADQLLSGSDASTLRERRRIGERSLSKSLCLDPIT